MCVELDSFEINIFSVLINIYASLLEAYVVSERSFLGSKWFIVRCLNKCTDVQVI